MGCAGVLPLRAGRPEAHDRFIAIGGGSRSLAAPPSAACPGGTRDSNRFAWVAQSTGSGFAAMSAISDTICALLCASRASSASMSRTLPHSASSSEAQGHRVRSAGISVRISSRLKSAFCAAVIRSSTVTASCGYVR